MKKLIFSVFLFLAVALDVAAQGPPIFTDTPIMLGLEGRGIRTFGNIVSMENATAYIIPLLFPTTLLTNGK